LTGGFRWINIDDTMISPCRISLAAALTVAAVLCQQAPNSWENQRNLPRSPEVHPDRTVTFRLFAPDAHEVLLVGAPIIAVTKGPKAFTKDDKGRWSVTIGPLPPGYYNYGFAVDGGIRSPDPSNPNVEVRRWGHTSYFDVPGDSPQIQEVQQVPHGTVHINTYDSKSLGTTRNVYVYTPPGYEQSNAKYPVLYLLHGSGLVEEAWISAGRANIIVDNLLAQGKVRPMVLVMPYGHVARAMADEPDRGAGRGGGPGTQPDGFEKDLIGDVMPLIDKTYRVLTDRDHQAIAGLSMGGGQAMQVGLRHPELFSSIATFSGSIPYRGDLDKMDGAFLNQKFKVLWVGCGTDDPAFNSNKAIGDLLEAKKVHHVFRASGGEHIWPVWQLYLSEFTPLLF
jgi:enterochelin esterase family protein